MEGRNFYVIRGDEIIWGPHSYPDAETDAQLVVQPSLGEEIVTEFPPKGRIWDKPSNSWRPKTLAESFLSGEIPREEFIFRTKTIVHQKLNRILEHGVNFKDTYFQCREEDLIRITMAVKMIELGGGWNGFWRDRFNNWIPISNLQLNELALSMGAFYQRQFITSRQIIDKIASLNDKELAKMNIDELFEYSSTGE